MRTELGLVADGVSAELVPPHAWLLRWPRVGMEVPVISMLLSGGGGLKWDWKGTQPQGPRGRSKENGGGTKVKVTPGAPARLTG